jgi:tRNA threonylcarbamoyladenosine biosynthesis protein TsaE
MSCRCTERRVEAYVSSPSRETLRLASHSEDETRAFGMRLARHLQGGELIGLVGELGAGKTCFVRGLAEGLDIAPHKVRSPTFTLVNEYSGGRLPLYHIDLYRLAPSPADRMALRDYLYGDGVCVVEWFERLGEASPHLWIQFTFVGADERALVAQAHGAQYDALLKALREE